jgi:NitT/TauT family transport system ATP-binding protein
VLVTHSIEEAALLGRKILLLNEPPNREANIHENSNAGGTGYRETAEYAALCHTLREKMEIYREGTQSNSMRAPL